MERLTPCPTCSLASIANPPQIVGPLGPLGLLHRFVRSMHKLHHATILLLVLNVIGCNPSPSPTPTPDNLPKIITVRAVAYQDEQPILAHAIAQVADNPSPGPGPNPSPSPSPDDKPKVGDVCPNCDGRGKSGDGINPCRPCKGDGRVDEGDPILVADDSVTPTPDEEDVEHVTQADFQKLQESVVASLHELNKHLKDLEDRANKAFDQTQEGIEANKARINELEASVRALELNLRNHALNHPAPGKPSELPLQEKTPSSKSTKYKYAIQYEGAWYYWDEANKHFINLTTLQSIPFPTLTDISARVDTELQVCNGTVCKMCRIAKVAQ